MRNLKKLLALTLAMVMAFSLMLTANAAVKYDDYTDKDSITDEFTEAVQVLTGLEVMQGDEKGFRPSDKITRAEAAAVIYRAVTGDVTDRQTDLYKDYGTFVDVKSDDWFAGYVGYCQNAGYIKGTSPTTFNPYGQVTGYEVLAMILRAVGYGKNNEFTGSSWQVNVAALSKQLGVTADVVSAHMDQTLNMAAPREVVADLVFMTMTTVPTVTYTPALAYNDKNSITSGTYNATLGQLTFGLWYETEWKAADDWGRPGYSWYQNGARTGWTDINTGKAYIVRESHPLYTGTKTGNLVATIIPDYDYETKEQVRECDVAEALDIDVSDNFDLYVNAKTVTAENYQIVATDTVTKVGGTGRVSEFYYETESKWFTEETNVAVMIDTMLARVTDKHDAKLDPAGHVITPAKLEVTVYDGGVTTNVAAPTMANAQSSRIISKKSSDATNWDDYSKGDYILIHAYTDKTHDNGDDPKWGNNVDRDTQNLKEEAAFRTNKVLDTTKDYPANTLVQGTNAWVLQEADSKQGKQTVTYWNQNKHQVDGTDYNDQICLFLDRAGTVTNTTFTWFFDLYGNLIGIGDAHATTFGVITSVYSAMVQGDADTTGAVKAIANVRYTDGTTGTVQIDRFLMSYNTGDAIPAKNPNSGTLVNKDLRVKGTALTAANTLNLRPVFDTAAHPALSAAWDLTPGATNPSSTVADGPAWLYMSPSTVTNTNAHFTDPAAMHNDAFHVLYDSLFQFSVASDNTVVATEVAGGYGTTGVPTGNTNPNFADKADAVTNSGTAVDAVADSKLFKNLAYISLETDNTAGADAYVYMNNDTQILIRLSATGRTINNYTLETLPGDVDIPTGSMVSWADTDGDNRADYVYIQGANIPSTVTYGLFYYDGGAAQWDAATNTGTIAGYLNGEPETITIKGSSKRDIFTAINASTLNAGTANATAYQGKLYALQFVNGEVNTLMFAKNQQSAAVWGQYILADNDATPVANLTGTVLKLNAGGTAPEVDNVKTGNGTGDNFRVGSANGNPYTQTTEAVYYHDTNSSTGTATSLNYVVRSGGNWIEVRTGGTLPTAVADTTYWLAPNVKIYGELDWLNRDWECYVTMVYDAANANAVTEIYITHDPDITPDSPTTAVTGANAYTVPAGTTQASLATILGAGTRDIAVYSPKVNNPTGMPGLASSAPAADLLYFPFSVAAADAGTATLEIRNAADNSLVFSGSMPAAAGNRCCVIDMTGKTTTPADLDPGMPMSSGIVYNFQVVAGTGTILSIGSFSIG